MKKFAKESLEKLKRQRAMVCMAIDNIEAIEIRKANGPLIGRYFKTSEGRSGRFPQYARVTRMDQHGMLYFDSFQRDKFGNTHVYLDHCGYHMQHWKPIAWREYRTAANRIIAHVHKTIMK